MCPHQLVAKQHFHSAYAISKFYDHDNQVEIKLKKNDRTFRRGKKYKGFKAYFAWNQWAELGYISSIESDYHKEIDIKNDISKRNHTAITKYWLLWRLRFDFYKNPPPNEIFNLNSPPLSMIDKEDLDRRGIFYIEEGGVYSSKNVAAIQIYSHLILEMDKYRNLEWGLIEASEGEFLVADYCRDLAFMPITPKLAFAVGFYDKKISKQEVAEFNKESITRASDFYFSRQLILCPVADKIMMLGVGNLD